MTFIKLNKKDIAIKVTPMGKTEVILPKNLEQELSGIQLHTMLKEIRKLELVFTEIVNETFIPETIEEEEEFEFKK